MLINLEALPGRRPQSDWKLVKVALLPGKTQLYNLACYPGETTNVAKRNPEIVRGATSMCAGRSVTLRPSAMSTLGSTGSTFRLG